MQRSKRIVLVSHCVLNQNAVVQPLARAEGPMRCAQLLLDSDCGIYQMPCPEMRMCGMGRVGMNAAQYGAIRGFHQLCADMAEEVIRDLQEYLSHGYTIVGLIAINGSPSCSVSGRRGVLMQHLFSRLEEEHIKLPYLEIPESGEDANFLEAIRTLVSRPEQQTV